MTAHRPSALLFLRSLILAVAWGGAVVSGLLGDVALGQSTPTGFSLIPGGSFTMGRTSGDTDVEAPPITVTVSTFYIQQTETTKAQWDEVRTWAVSNGYTDLPEGSAKTFNHPVGAVNWWDVVKWCNARSEKEGLTPVYTVSGTVMKTGTMFPSVNWIANGYRIPTEAEWEKAARGGVSGKRFPWGTDTINHGNVNYYANSSIHSYDTTGYTTNTYHPTYASGGFPYTAPVGSFGANGYGLYDMAGNSFEWCWDWYSSSYYITSAGTMDPRGPESGTNRVKRGGSWNNTAFFCRNASRSYSTPDNTGGFRPARNIVSLIDSHPLPLTVSRDDSATFSVAATGNGTLTYQWQKDGVDIPGATSSSFTLAAAQPWHIGDYRVKVTDSVGTATSESATLNLTGVSSEIWNDLIAYYPLDGDSNDKSPYANHATGNVIEYSSNRFGVANKTATYGGSYTNGNWLEVPQFTNLQYKPITYSVWIKFSSLPPSGGYTSLIGRMKTWNGEDGALVVYNAEGLQNKIGYYTGGDLFKTNFTPSLNQWHNIVFTQDIESKVQIHADGILIGEGIFSAFQNQFQTIPFRIGASSIFNGVDDNSTHSVIGFIDDVRIYNRALSATEVQALYVSESSLPPTLSSPSSTQITASSATLGGNVTSDGGVATTEHGVVYSVTATNNDPLISGTGVTKVTATGTTGAFTTPVISLTPGTNYSYKAYATNSQGTTYTSVATFTTLSNNADLSALTLNGGTLTPTFASTTTAYAASVSNATTSITVTPTRAQANATIEARVNSSTYAAVSSGSASASLPLNVGTNTVDVRVTAEDGTTQKTYTVSVTRDKAAQSITFANPGAQLANATLNLSASGSGSGNPVTFTFEGPATLGEGNLLTFTGAGEVRVRASQAGNSDFDPAADVTHTFNVVLPQPDVAVGLTLDSLVGLRSYGNSGQQLRLVSRFARPVTGFAILANRTILPDRRAADRLAVRANPGNRFFSITYSDVDGNATAGIVSGFYRTPAIDGTDAIRWLTARISPNKAILSEKKGKRTVYLRKTFTTRVRASSTLYPPASDAGVIEVLHQ